MLTIPSAPTQDDLGSDVEGGFGNMRSIKSADDTASIKKNLSHKEEEGAMEVIMYVHHSGGRADVEDVERIVRWKERFESTIGPLLKFLEGRPHLFALSAENSMVTAISRNVKPDPSKRAPLPREKTRLRQAPTAAGKVSVICVAGSIDLDALTKRYKRLDYTSSVANGVLHVTNVKGYGSTGDDSTVRFDMYVFGYGSIVWWGTDMSQYKIVENDFLTASNAIGGNVLRDRYKQSSLDNLFPVWCTFEVVGKEGKDEDNSKFLEALQRDHILLQSDRPAFKQTISHALAQSAKLDVIEPMINDLLKLCKPLPLQIRAKGHADISSIKVNQLKGEVFLYRMELKSDSELLDEPEFFWEYSWFKPLYQVVRDDYGIESRVMLLDEKLSAVQVTLSMIGEQFEQDHGRRLEWIVIILILIEVVIAVVELLLETGYGTSILKK
eukprot:PhF_6_TR22298/c0_g1_i1/m.31553